MSYARFGPDSDVYVFPNVNGMYECCGCSLEFKFIKRFRTAEDTINHLNDHVSAGHKVPDYAFTRLNQEREDEQDADNSGNGRRSDSR